MGFALQQTGGIQKTLDAVGRLRAFGQPIFGTIKIKLHALGIVFGQHGIESADFFDEAAITGITAISDNNRIVRTLFGTTACKTNF